MTQEEQRQQVREAIAKELYYRCVRWTGRPNWYDKWTDTPEAIKEDWRRDADVFLALAYPSGAPMLAVLDENQELPDNHAFNVSTNIEFKSFMLKVGWRKTIA